MTFSPVDLILVITTFQCVLFALFLFRHERSTPRPDRFLALLLLVTAASVTHSLLMEHGFYRERPEWAFTIGFSGLLCPPLLFFYTRALTRPERPWASRDVLHLLPAMAMGLLFVVLFHSRSLEEKRAFLQEPPWLPILLLLLTFHVTTVAYLAAGLVLVHRHGVRLRTFFSSVERHDLRWLRAVLLGYAILWLLNLGTHVLSYYWPAYPWEVPPLRILQLFIFVFINVLIYSSLRQPELLAEFRELEPEKPTKYQRSSLADDDAERYEKRLLLMMEVERPYLDPNLTLKTLGEALDVPPRHLSQVLNDGVGQSFFDFVNRYRVEEMKRLLTDPKQAGRAVLDIGLTAGFHSKSSMNAAFRKHAGVTPSEFRRRPGIAAGESRTPRK